MEYISYPRHLHPELYDEINQAFVMTNVTPKLVQQVKTKSATLALVANQVGFAIVPKSLSQNDNNQIEFLPIKQALPSVDYYLYCRDLERHPGLRALLRMLKEELEEATPPSLLP
ncbi:MULTISPECIES: LysR substrate-binding domain-containing protein [unclassified Pseudoalteromonas]|uniref:LysR substrate-binding domain-containing protein n=1 Tax=unclassified Pseudoalteromonas TaxID=194690 RepID=UPI0020969DF5|nr:LysR substrate-binding domain-containing protein [Pseudoalteromonas sp. XMcav2-N]MCO7187446.1 LysR substrate-binding domain-containing protein [Pseudoalteromonas sp. XMcav2-N]